MYQFVLKNKKIAYVIIALFVMTTTVFVWNNYEIKISERPIKPLRPPAVISGKCVIEQCHGLDITCGSNIAEQCTMEMRIDDFCREYVRCEKVDRECRLIKEPKFEACKSCVEKCSREEDQSKAFECAGKCGETAGKSGSEQEPVVEVVKLCETENPRFNPTEECQKVINEKYPSQGCTFEIGLTDWSPSGSCRNCTITCK